MNSINKKALALLLALPLAVACGASQTSKKGMSDLAAGAPPPPDGKNLTKNRKVSREAEADFQSAVAHFNEQAKAGWNPGSCASAASKFDSVADDNPKLIEARYNAGVAYQMCGDNKAAEDRYQKVLKLNPKHAPSLGNLGKIYFQGGNEQRAKQYWEQAFAANKKTSVAARNGLAWLLIRDIRDTNNRRQFATLEKEIKNHLSSILAVENDNVEAYVLYSLLYQEGSERNKSRLAIADLLLDEGAKHNPNYAPLHNARGLLLLRRENVSNALKSFRRAAELDPKFVEAKMNVGNIVLGFRKYDEAKAQFEQVLQLDPKNYDAMIGLGIAKRGLGDLDGAEMAYKSAMKLDGRRADAYYNLGVLYYSFRANQGDNLQASVAAYEKAKGYYKQYLGKDGKKRADEKEARETIKDATKIVKQLKEVIAAQKSSGGA